MLLTIDDGAMESVYLANHIKRALSGPMWHGPALDEVLAGVTAELAAARPIAGAHTIWEIVLHVTTWAEIARDRLRGERMGDPPADVDWPPVAAGGASVWTAAIDRLREAHRALARDARRLNDEILHEKMAGLEYSRSNLLHGVIEHGTYHAGQIALLKKALGPGPAA